MAKDAPNTTRTHRERRPSTLLVTMVCVGVGVVLAFVRLGGLGEAMVHLSYDLMFPLRMVHLPSQAEDVVLLEIDEKTLVDLRINYEKDFPRQVLAEGLEHVTSEHPRLVVFDIFFQEPLEAAVDAQLARAMATNGRVILAGLSIPIVGVAGGAIKPPHSMFLDPAVDWGLAVIYEDPDGSVRRIHGGTEAKASLAWVAAEQAGASIAQTASRPQSRHRRAHWNRWLNHYEPGRIPRISFSDAAHQERGFFTDKYVFIGSRTRTGKVGDEKDEFGTPWARYGGGSASGAEIVVTTFLNLLHGEWLERLPWWVELMILIGTGLVMYPVLRWLPRRWMTWACGVAGMLLIVGLSALLANQWQLWFAWVVPAFIQIPVAALFLTMGQPQAHALIEPLPVPETLRTTPQVPNHTLIKNIGSGAYGEVWLARSEIGTFHAVKFVKRALFEDSAPYEREYMGVKNYMPISKSHLALLNITFIGKDPEDSCFFYIMETADDMETGPDIHPDHYAPKSLFKVLKKEKRMSPESCLELALHLSDALAALHRHGLIHRDIKPANIIYVNGMPKLADIGLVSVMQESVSFVGTEDYIPREGPGEPSADIFALGRVLFRALTGFGARRFPDLPDELLNDPSPLVIRLNEIIQKAGVDNPAERHPSAAQLHEELVQLSDELAGPTLV